MCSRKEGEVTKKYADEPDDRDQENPEEYLGDSQDLLDVLEKLDDDFNREFGGGE
jgi:hypothetical protein